MAGSIRLLADMRIYAQLSGPKADQKLREEH